MNPNVKYYVGLVASICGALLGQAEVIPEPYRHYVTIVFIATTAASGYMIQREPSRPSP